MSAFPEILAARQASRHSRRIRPSSISQSKWPTQSVEMFLKESSRGLHDTCRSFNSQMATAFVSASFIRRDGRSTLWPHMRFLLNRVRRYLFCATQFLKSYSKMYDYLYLFSLISFVFFHRFLSPFALARSSTPRDVVRNLAMKRCILSFWTLFCCALSPHALLTFKKREGLGLRMGEKSKGERKAMEKQKN